MATVTQAALDRRRKYNRPQAVIFADNAKRVEFTTTLYKPTGSGTTMIWLPEGQEGTDWIILSDHNRTDLGITSERVENRKRMIDATMRSYHTADKNSLSLSWSELPSRASMQQPTVNTPQGTLTIPPGCVATIDGGAGGTELKHWYDTHQGPFYVLLAYDDYKAVEVPLTAPGDPPNPNHARLQYQAFGNYKQAKIMFFNSFTHDVTKRLQYLENDATGNVSYKIEYDSWNVSIELVEA